MKVTAIIVHWNTPDTLRTQSFKLRAQKDIEVIIIDNASEKSIKNLKLRNGNLHIIENNTNLGFAKACNQGAKIAKGEWLLFLNPDTHISSDEILKFVENAEKKNLDAASPEQIGDGYFKPLPTWLSLLAEFSPVGRVLPLSLFKKHTLFGGCLLIKASVLKKLGGWDEDFFLWFEDSDLTKRLYDNGYRVGWIPVKYKHIGGAAFKQLSVKSKKTMFFKSMNLYNKKHSNFFSQLVINLLTKINKV